MRYLTHHATPLVLNHQPAWPTRHGVWHASPSMDGVLLPGTFIRTESNRNLKPPFTASHTVDAGSIDVDLDQERRSRSPPERARRVS